MKHDTKITVNGVPWGPDPKRSPCPCKDPRDGDSMFLAVLLATLLTVAIVAVRTCTHDQGSHVRGTAEAQP